MQKDLISSPQNYIPSNVKCIDSYTKAKEPYGSK